MRPRDLDRRITLEAQQDAAVGDFHELEEQYVPVRTIWAQVLPVNGREAFAAAQKFAEVDVVFRVWEHEARDVTPEWRVRYGGRLHDIVAVLPIPRDRAGLEIRAKARAE